jgi:hypothetical protein
MSTKTIGLGLVLGAALLAAPGPARAQLHVDIGIAFPEPPPLVVVAPGVRVVPEFDEEVYFVGGWYWVSRDGGWYRTRDYHGGWRPVRRAWVPGSLVRIPPGQYRHYYRDDDGRWRSHHPDEYREWRDRHPVDERRAWWNEHRHDRQVRYEQQHAWQHQERVAPGMSVRDAFHNDGPRRDPPRHGEPRHDEPRHDDRGHERHDHH